MSNENDFLRTKLALGIAALVIGVPAFAFALFGWTQSSLVPFGEVGRYVCLVGSLGAFIIGGLQLNESLLVRKSFAKPVKPSALDFLAIMECEDGQKY